MEKAQEKAIILREALPYIKKYTDKIFVIKYGGNAMIDDDIKRSVMGDIAMLRHVGINVVVVHGGGPNISKEMQKEHIEPKFIDGLRYTDEKTIEVVKRVSFEINNGICEMLRAEKCQAETFEPKKIKAKVKDRKLGLVGEITAVKQRKLLKMLSKEIVPVISPLGWDGKHYLNINADTVATMVAEAVGAEKLTILTDVEGVFEDGKLISHLSISVAKAGIERGVISKGMIPKVLACVHAVNADVPKAHLIDGTLKHSLLLEIFTDKGVGTEIVKDDANGISTDKTN